MGIFAVVQEDPCPVFIPNTYVDVGRLKIKLSGADNELVLAYDGHRRHIHLQEVRSSGSPSSLYHHVIQALPVGAGEPSTVCALPSVTRSATLFSRRLLSGFETTTVSFLIHLHERPWQVDGDSLQSGLLPAPHGRRGLRRACRAVRQ